MATRFAHGAHLHGPIAPACYLSFGSRGQGPLGLHDEDLDGDVVCGVVCAYDVELGIRYVSGVSFVAEGVKWFEFLIFTVVLARCSTSSRASPRTRRTGRSP
jgi:hypothetical protein